MKRTLNLILVFCCTLLLAVGSLAYASEMIPDGLADITGGEGTFFQLKDLSVSLDTTASIRGVLEGDASTLSFHAESISGPATSGITFSGLTPSTTYYLYVDTLHSGQELTSDEAGQLYLTQDLTEPHLIFLKDHHSTVFISAAEWTDDLGVLHNAGWSYSDGTDLNGVLGIWDQDTLTATLLGDNSEPIEILSNDIILDGAGFTSTNPVPGSYDIGVYLYSVYRVTVKNLTLEGWGNGIHARFSSSNTFTNTSHRNVSRGIHLFASGSNQITDNVIDGASNAIFVSIYCYGSTIDNNIVRNSYQATYSMGYTGSNIFSNNLFESVARGLYFYNSTYNRIFGNTFSDIQTGLYFDGYSPYSTRFNKMYNNNFKNVDKVGDFAGEGNTFNEQLPVGGNFYDDWTGPDLNNDGIVDIPRPLFDHDNQVYAYDNFPFTTENGWVANQAPVFDAIAPLEVLAYSQINLTVSATDPDGDAIVSFYAGNLPAGASFDSATQQFIWRPNSAQTGVYVVNFFATDDGSPAATGQIDVVITVGAISSPIDLNATIIAEITALDLLPEVENSYMANLQSAQALIEKGNIAAVLNQYQAVIHKIEQDLKQGKINQADADLLIMMVSDAIALLN